jgi:hypothetical protein
MNGGTATTNASRLPHLPFRAYEAWKDGQEIPLNGTDLKNWPGVTPAQLKTCQAATIKTIEDLANANADAVRKLGMGRCPDAEGAAYLESASTNKASEEIVSLQTKMEALTEALAKKDRQIEELMEQITDETPKRGRPQKGK